MNFYDFIGNVLFIFNYSECTNNFNILLIQEVIKSFISLGVSSLIIKSSGETKYFHEFLKNFIIF